MPVIGTGPDESGGTGMVASPSSFAGEPLNSLEPLRILYIVGWGRSGSTFLGHVLGQMEGLFFGGELWYLGQRGWNQNYQCGCGKRFLECEVWSVVTRRLADDIGEAGLQTLASIPGSTPRTRSLLKQVLSGGSGLPGVVEERVVPTLGSLYRQIAAVARARLIIDSSKAPMYARLLERIPGAKLYMVHLVRDPRATGFAMSKRKYDPAGGRYLPRAGALKNGVMWSTWNIAAEILWNRRGRRAHYLRIRYEDLARDPGPCIHSILDFVGFPPDRQLVSGAGEVTLRATHSVSGNPDRMKVGATQIRADEEWRSRMAWVQKGMTVLLTWPLLFRYGYRLWE